MKQFDSTDWEPFDSTDWQPYEIPEDWQPYEPRGKAWT